MGRLPCEKNGLKKGPWTPEEDKILIDYIQEHGYGNWRTLPKNAGLQRCGKSCRLRWTNYLKPDIKRGRFSQEEEDTIIHLHSILGNKWSNIATQLPGRTDNEIKNYWNTHIRKKLLRMGIDPVTHSPRLDLLDISSILNSSQINISKLLGVQTTINPEILRFVNSFISSHNQNQNQIQKQSFVPRNVSRETELCGPSEVVPNQHSSDPNHEIMLSNLNEEQVTDWENNGIVPINVAADDYYLNSLSEFNDEYYGSDILNPSEFVNQSMNFTSVLSTPSSSPTLLNSDSTYCSNLMKFESSGFLDVGGFM